MSEKHIGEVVQVIGPVLDIRFGHDELPALLNAIEIDHEGTKLTAEVAQSDRVGKWTWKLYSFCIRYFKRIKGDKVEDSALSFSLNNSERDRQWNRKRKRDMEPGLLPEFLQQFLSACFSLGDSGSLRTQPAVMYPVK